MFENAYSHPKRLEVMGYLTPKEGAVVMQLSKRNTSYDMLIVKIDPPVRTGRNTKHKVTKCLLKKLKYLTSHVFAETTLLQRHMELLDIVVYSKFHRNPFIGFEAGRNLAFTSALLYTAVVKSI